ncbi:MULTISPECIES: ribonuclease HII [Desulfosporosinus]|uniref:Ribonuclease HII n=1 Tax=Desulfosporosinus nitroreducens TaxID=2018668 RepID=A0ABT8QK28_9FIRM|nr:MULTISPECIES: ribonuclease HII [Desulfosporosinus]MCO1601111.1 ribonuclease HII [Desulfosporosinus nitroreducens]MCO5385443.1 ribonuclease HII [Desulfosporosinus sp.]MDA8223714.1 ribonuclease HII [Desulfitobacterium hafniense]MDO0821615.1 ribonuclease HII [Desulfosporosinus nitroreducens]
MEPLSQMNIREVQEALYRDPSPRMICACQNDSRQGVRRLAVQLVKYQQAQALEQARIQQLLVEENKLWKQGYLLLAGVDEAGRGPLAGPVVAGACILPAKFDLPGLNDSKMLTESKREKLFIQIQKQAIDYAIGSAEPAEIDALNILQATKLAMKRSIEGLTIRPHYLLIDALNLPDVQLPQLPLIGGDHLSASIAAASILAKVTRDRLMVQLHSLYPEYTFSKNKGYGTSEHMQVLKRLGPCPLHRKSFAPVRQETSIS